MACKDLRIAIRQLAMFLRQHLTTSLNRPKTSMYTAFEAREVLCKHLTQHLTLQMNEKNLRSLKEGDRKGGVKGGVAKTPPYLDPLYLQAFPKKKGGGEVFCKIVRSNRSYSSSSMVPENEILSRSYDCTSTVALPLSYTSRK